MIEKTSYSIPSIFEQAIQRFLAQFDTAEVKALGNPPQIKAELRRVERQGRSEIRPVIVIKCEGIGHRSALLCLKSRLREAARAVGISSIGLAVDGQSDIGFFCD